MSRFAHCLSFILGGTLFGILLGAGLVIYGFHLGAHAAPAAATQNAGVEVLHFSNAPAARVIPAVLRTVNLVAPTGRDLIIPLPVKAILPYMEPAKRQALAKALPLPKTRKGKKHGKG